MMVSEAVQTAEHIPEVYWQSGADSAKEAVLDGRAQSFVVGRDTLEKYADYLRSHGIQWTPKDYPCDKKFRFGNDDTLQCTTAAVIPVNFAGRTGHLYVHGWRSSVS